MKLSYAQEFFLRGVAVCFILILAMLFLTSCDLLSEAYGIDQEEEPTEKYSCEEIAKQDYNINNPYCVKLDYSREGGKCKCRDKVCTNTSCLYTDPIIDFDILTG